MNDMNEKILSLAKENAPCYIYSLEKLSFQAKQLKEVFPDFDFLFSVKANPFPPVVSALAKMGIGADAASAQEVFLAENCGMKKEDIYFSAAGKSDAAIEKTDKTFVVTQDDVLYEDTLGAQFSINIDPVPTNRYSLKK